MKNKRIAVLCPALSSGGAERVLSVLAPKLTDEYEAVSYIMWYDLPVFYSIDERVSIVSIERISKSKNFAKKMYALRRYIVNNRINLLLAFGAPFSMISLLSIPMTKCKIIAAERIDPKSFIWGKFLMHVRDLLYYTSDGILVQTQSGKEYFKGTRLYNKTDIVYNPLIMDSEWIGSAINAEKRDLVISVARLTPQKNQNQLISTFIDFHQRYPSYELVIYGEGSERSKLEELINQFKATDYIHLPGVEKNVWKKMKQAKMFVLTSNYEGMSNAMIEAMCLGVPCISTKVSGAVDLIVSGKNGLLIDIGDKEQLLDSMSKIATDEKLALNISKEATKVYNILNVDTISGEWIDYINSKLQ